MTARQWMIYGANGYTGELIARQAKEEGLTPVLAGRSEGKIAPLARELGFEFRAFALDSPEAVAEHIADMAVVVHAAGPFSATAPPMMTACIKAGTHYCDITGEIGVFEHAHALDDQARAAGVILCPGVGFDVIPTDCVAACLKEALPDATHLTLGFDSRSGFSPGTAKTSVEGMADGGKVRRDGRIVTVPLASGMREIDFGDGSKTAMTIPWGDVSTAYYTTGIPNIEVYIPSSPGAIRRIRRLNWVRPLLGLGVVQGFLKAQVEKKVRGPSAEKREKQPTHVWGEAVNASGERKVARIRTANGYTVTLHGAVMVARHLMETDAPGGYYTPSKLMGKDLVTRLPGSGELTIE
ncbi:saccharopine dehydrogenase NADP-binding domain-containing protein [Ectothiorhodospiraceae bacterium WFHF3C12]|nr:saccharopine dehydrogenase NADP-binding domain-containing protein [Ectothiorhodospiraceae bacterium WFHF3C12]